MKTSYFWGMVLHPETAYKTAEFLLQIKAIQLRPDQPFQWASGWRSPIYCDNRKTLSYPTIRTYLREQVAEGIISHFGKPDVIAGVATGAIALGSLVAQHLQLPFIYVRPEPKSHGMKNQIEGVLEAGQRVVVFEDLVSTGGSSLKAVEALRSEGAEVLGMFALFTYGFQMAVDRFASSQCPLVTLSDYEHLLMQATKTGYVHERELSVLKEWRQTPESWKQ
jgi:orotate phosphoribosyltransferase